jgi:hypothetical protein
MGDERLMGWGPISPDSIGLYPMVGDSAGIEGYVYLRYYNIVNGQLLDLQNIDHSLAEYQDKFESNSKIYTNGGSEIYKF